MLENTFYIVSSLFFMVTLAYFFVVMKEKAYLKKKMIVIDSKAVNSELIRKIGSKEMLLQKKEIRSGDEIKIKSKKGSFKGVFLGSDKPNKNLVLINKKNEVIFIPIAELIKISIISRYGKFLNL
jgi:hypothetical protein